MYFDSLRSAANLSQCYGLTPLHAARGRAYTRRTFAEYDATFGQIIGCHFDMNAVAHDGADAEFTHLPRRVSDDPVIIFQHDAKAAVRIDFVDHPFERKQLFFGQKLSQPPRGLQQILCRSCPIQLRS
jgi:hypothetical protein